MLDSGAYDLKSGNPFSDRPPTSMRDEEAQKALDTAVAELDSNVPENFDASVWDRLCRYRRAKIEMEMNVSCVVAVFQYELIARTCCCFVTVTASLKIPPEKAKKLEHSLQQLSGISQWLPH